MLTALICVPIINGKYNLSKNKSQVLQPKQNINFQFGVNYEKRIGRIQRTWIS